MSYSGIFSTLKDPGISKTPVQIELWHIKNSGIFRKPEHLNPEAYSEHLHIQNPCIFKTLTHSELWHIKNQMHIWNPTNVNLQ